MFANSVDENDKKQLLYFRTGSTMDKNSQVTNNRGEK